MNITTYTFRSDDGWSQPLPARLGPSDVAFVFGDPSFARPDGPIADVIRSVGDGHVIGCSTAGEICGPRAGDGCLTVAVAHFESTEIKSAWAPAPQLERSRTAGQQLGTHLAGPDLTAVFVITDGLTINGSELVAGLSESVDEGVVISGGMAGDNTAFSATWVVSGGEIRSGIAAAVAFYGPNVRVTTGSRGGWSKFGPERYVTRSEGSVLYELDGQPALKLYKRYLGDLVDELPASALLFPLAVRHPGDDDHSVVRTILAVDEADQSMTFAGDVPQGHIAQLMHANTESLITGAEEAMEQALDTVEPSTPVLSLAISCVGRRLVLGSRVEEEVEAVFDLLPPGSQQVGFYSYGEISATNGGRCELLNQTMTITTISEAP